MAALEGGGSLTGACEHQVSHARQPTHGQWVGALGHCQTRDLSQPCSQQGVEANSQLMHCLVGAQPHLLLCCMPGAERILYYASMHGATCCTLMT
jgi:hypothetical protein